MRMSIAVGVVLMVGMGGVGGAGAWGQCREVNFETFNVGVDASNFLSSVTFSTSQSCPSMATIPVVVDSLGDTSSGEKGLSLTSGCPDFSPDRLWIDFPEFQEYVEFTVGSRNELSGRDFEVRAFGSFGAQVYFEAFKSASGVNRLVQIDLGSALIQRVEVWQVGDDYEVIDDLKFGRDTTPPEVQIESPEFLDCVCGGSSVWVTGTIVEDDGELDRRTLFYRSVDAAPDAPWTEVLTSFGTSTSFTFLWNTSPVPDGLYYVRVDQKNECGLVSSDRTVVRVDRELPGANISGFRGGRLDGSLVGTVEVLGGVSDECGVSWDVDYQLASGGPWTQILAGQGGTSCILGTWDTTSVADGTYRVRLMATDGCGNERMDEEIVEVDNTRPCIESADIVKDGVVNIADLLAFLGLWFGA